MMETFNPGWKMTLFTAFFCPLLFVMGQWQLEREQEKISLQARYDQRLAADSVVIESIDWNSDDLDFLRFNATGEFDNTHSFLLDNRTNSGRVGYELLTPFRLRENQILLVNRGWIPLGANREVLPSIDPVVGDVTIEASVYVPLGETFLLSSAQELGESWPRVVQSLDMDQLSETYGAPMLAYSSRLTERSVAAELIDWPVVNMAPEKHRGYAVQWFAMLAALIAMYIYLGFKSPELKKTEEEK